jgi:deoxyhypusine monooxygenase
MFKLRNIGGADAAAALCRALGDSSALFRHEIAFVLGQMGFAGSADALKAVLCNVEENSMVRHEAAEALGALGEEDACRQALMQFGGDADPVVAESCMLALDMLQYWADYKNPPDGHVA